MKRNGPGRAVGNAHPAAIYSKASANHKQWTCVFRKEAFFMQKNTVRKTFRTPFSREYWMLALGEMKKPRTLIFAALILALRIAAKPLSISIAGDLTEGVGFIINAFGSMVYGPVVALLCGALSDTLGFLVFPSGVYFPAYMITEMAGGFVFALFLYRAEITIPRLILCRFTICFLVNVVLAYPIHVAYYSIMLGKDYALAWIRIVKNIVLFPVEAVILAVVFRSLLPPFKRLGYLFSGEEGLALTARHVVLLAVLFAVGAGCVFGYGVYSYNTTTLSKEYTAEQRLARNRALETYVLEKHPELKAEETVCIIDAAYPRAFSPEVRYEVSVYRADVSGAEDAGALMAELEGLSKSKAAAREELTRLFSEEIVLTENAKEPEKGREAH